ncbi:hypothetical protein TURU_000429 [Turdus rufiventris]|nr:hypothetical protein TURU_000429 [Turdus rufiventris]
MGNTPSVPEEAEDDNTCTVKSYQPLPESPASAPNGAVAFAQSPPLAVDGAGMSIAVLAAGSSSLIAINSLKSDIESETDAHEISQEDNAGQGFLPVQEQQKKNPGNKIFMSGQKLGISLPARTGGAQNTKREQKAH